MGNVIDEWTREMAFVEKSAAAMGALQDVHPKGLITCWWDRGTHELVAFTVQLCEGDESDCRKTQVIPADWPSEKR